MPKFIVHTTVTVVNPMEYRVFADNKEDAEARAVDMFYKPLNNIESNTYNIEIVSAMEEEHMCESCTELYGHLVGKCTCEGADDCECDFETCECE